MNGWFPRVSPDGLHVASGFGTDGWWLDWQPMGVGMMPNWLTDDEVLYYRDDTHELWRYSLSASGHTFLCENAQVNGLAAGGGRFAWYGTGPSGVGIYTDDGRGFLGCYEPAVWGDHLAYVDVSGALVVDGMPVRSGPILTTTTPPRIRASALGLTWVEIRPDGFLEAWGMLWGGQPERVQPSYLPCAFAVPVGTPNAPYLLAVDSQRVMLVPWGSHTGYHVASGTNLLHPDGAPSGAGWRVVWCSDTGDLHGATALPTDSQYNFAADPRPEMPQPVIRFDLNVPIPAVAPCTFTSTIRVRDYVETHRWRLKKPTDDRITNAPTPNDRNSYEFTFPTPGMYVVDVLAQGVKADTDHLPGSGGKIVYAGEQFVQVIEGVPVPPPTGYRGLCAGAAMPLSVAELVTFRDHGYEVVRPAMQWATAAQWAEWDVNCRAAGLMPFFYCVADEFVNAPVGAWVEARHAPDKPEGGIEPNFTVDAETYATIVNRHMPEARARRLRVFVGMTNINVADRPYVQTLDDLLDDDVGISFHPYALADGTNVWKDRSDLLDPMLAIIEGRPWVVGEMGRSQFDKKPPEGWWQRLLDRLNLYHAHMHLTEAEQLALHDQDFAWLQAKGSLVTVRYQINDAAERCPQHPTMPAYRMGGYGARRVNGSWKGEA